MKIYYYIKDILISIGVLFLSYLITSFLVSCGSGEKNAADAQDIYEASDGIMQNDVSDVDLTDSLIKDIISDDSDAIKETIQDSAPDDTTPDADASGETKDIAEIHDMEIKELPADSAADTGSKECTAADPLQPFEIGLKLPLAKGGLDPVVISGEAAVVFNGMYGGDYDWQNEIHFQMKETKEEITVLTKFPKNYQIPVKQGETVKFFIQREMPWWTNLYIGVWGIDGDLRFFAYDAVAPSSIENPYDCGKITPCPQFKLLETDCKAEDGECGKVIHPPVEFSLGQGFAKFTLEQGDIFGEMAAAATNRLILARVYKNITMECMDYPSGWIRAIIFDNFDVSQCYCYDKFDCSVYDVCETELNRCVKNKCLTEIDCQEDYFCDPYTGSCYLPPPSPQFSCTTDADCPIGGVCNYVCNTYLGFCQMSPCCYMKCKYPCSPLLQTCPACLSDCDCIEPGMFCDQETHECVKG
jgi:hypothetical protein